MKIRINLNLTIVKVILAIVTLFGLCITIFGIYLGFLFKEIFAFAPAVMGLVLMLITGIPLLCILREEFWNVFEKGMYGFVLFLGICVTVGSVVCFFNSVQYVRNAVAVEAEIVSIDKYYEKGSLTSRQNTEKHEVSINYAYNGEVYEDVELPSWWFTWEEGSKITVYCSEKEDGSILVRDKVDLWAVPVIIAFLGVIFVYGGIYFLRRFAQKAQNEKEAVEAM